MAQYEYLVVPFQGKLRGNGSIDEVSNQLQELINNAVSQGWEFYTINDVKIEISPGCLAALFGASITYRAYDQVIFRRPKNR